MEPVLRDIFVTRVEPSDQAANLPLNSEIRAFFSQAVDPDTLTTATFIVARNSAHPIAGEVTYETNADGEFIAIFTPTVVLQASTTYQITLVGYSNPFTGGTGTVIKSITNVTLGKNVTWTLSTGEVNPQPPVLLSPVRHSSIDEDRPVFEWNAVGGAEEYEIKIGTTELMSPLYLPEDSAFNYPLIIPGSETTWTPDKLFETGQQYYWRMRTRVGGVLSEWTPVLNSFYMLKPGEATPYVPEPSMPEPVDEFRLLTGSEGLVVVGIDPYPGESNVWPPVIRVTFNKPIDPTSIDLESVRIFGKKLIQSDCRNRESGVVTPLTVDIDPDAPNVLVISLSGSGGVWGRPSAVLDSIRIYEDMFERILGHSIYRYGFAKHFHDLAHRVDGEDQLYTDVQISQMRLAESGPFPTAMWKYTIFEIESAVEMREAFFQFTCAMDVSLGTSFRIYVSNDAGVNFVPVIFTYNPNERVQDGTAIFSNKDKDIQIRLEMSTTDMNQTPTCDWFMMLFNEQGQEYVLFDQLCTILP